MTTIEYFKSQAKNLHKDFKTQKRYFDHSLGRNLYEYAGMFFDIEALLNDFEFKENKFTLMNAQHIIAKVVGFKKWSEMRNASSEALELAKLLFENLDKIRYEEWEFYILDIEQENNVKLDDEDKLEIFKMVYVDVDGHQSDGYDYRLARIKDPSNEGQVFELPEIEQRPTVKISALPLIGADRKEFIEAANEKFEDLVQMMEPEHPELVRQLWNPEHYIDEYILKQDMLPIDRDYALSLVDAFLVHHFMALDIQADN